MYLLLNGRNLSSNMGISFTSQHYLGEGHDGHCRLVSTHLPTDPQALGSRQDPASNE